MSSDAIEKQSVWLSRREDPEEEDLQSNIGHKRKKRVTLTPVLQALQPTKSKSSLDRSGEKTRELPEGNHILLTTASGVKRPDI